MHSSSWYAKCYMAYVIDSPRSIELETELPRFHVPPAQYWIIRPDCKMEHSPQGLFALPAALLAWERTCHFKHCSCVIFTSNTDEIRGGSIVKNIAVICHYHFRRTFRYDFVNTDWYDTCVKNTATYYCSFIIRAYGFLQGHRLTLVIKHWRNRFYLKDVANRTRNSFN